MNDRKSYQSQMMDSYLDAIRRHLNTISDEQLIREYEKTKQQQAERIVVTDQNGNIIPSQEYNLG